MKESNLFIFSGAFALVFLFLVIFMYLFYKKNKNNKKKLKEIADAADAHMRMVLENSQNLTKFLNDLALVPVEFLSNSSLLNKIEQKFHVRNHDLYRFIKINDFVNSLGKEKKKILFQLLSNAVLRRPSYVIGSLIFRSVLENEIEARDALVEILKQVPEHDEYRHDVYHDLFRCLNKHLKHKKNLSRSAKDKLVSEIKKIKHLI